MLKKIARQILFFTLLLIGLGFYVWSEMNIPAVRSINIPIEEFPKKIKIAQISDTQGRGISPHGRLYRAIKDFKPDAIVLTGDMIDESTIDFAPTLETVKHLSLIAPTLFVPGNHEWANPNGRRFIKSIRENGASTLINDAEIVNGVSVCGVDDVNFALDNISKALSVNGRCDILLSHSPAINEDIRGLGIPLVLSGDTHGGQIRFPIIGAVILPGKNTPPHLVKGLAKDGDTQFYISAGLGTSIVPIRFMNRAEISLITVYPQ